MSSRVAIYARVSTTNHGQDVGLQTQELRQFAVARGWTVAGEYLDAGVSGAKESRPELNRLMATRTSAVSMSFAFGASTDSPVLSPTYFEHLKLSTR